MRKLPSERFENSQKKKGRVSNKVYQNKFAEATMGDTTKFDVLQISENDYNDIEYRVVDFIRNSQTKKSKLKNKFLY